MNKVFIAESLDGYIASANESLDWLYDVEGEGDNGYGNFLKGIDYIIMGRKTFDWLNALNKEELAEWPYKDKKTLVLTHSKSLQGRFSEENVSAFDNIQMLQDLEKDTWIVGGGELIRECLEKNIIDEMIISIAPILLGNGIPLFPKGRFNQKFELKSVKQYGQFVNLHLYKGKD